MRLPAYPGAASAGMAAALLSLLISSTGIATAHDAGTAIAPRASSEQSALAGHDTGLDEADEIAALEAIRVALSEVGDGHSYVWHRRYGRLSGVVQPTSSFKDPAGRVCRRITVILAAGLRTGRLEGVACRLANGRWQIDG